MTITIDLPPTQARSFQKLCLERGLEPDECASEVVQKALAGNSGGEDSKRSLPADTETVTLLKSWLAEAAAMDEQARQEAEADLQAFKDAMNDSRRAVGARILYP